MKSDVTAQNVKKKAQDFTASTSNVSDKAGANELGQRLHDAAAHVGQRVQETAAGAKDKADSALHTVGKTMSSVADGLHARAPHDGVFGSTAASVADNLHAGGHYLEGHRIDDLMSDVTAFLRRYPMQSLLVGFGVGFMLGTGLRRR